MVGILNTLAGLARVGAGNMRGVITQDDGSYFVTDDAGNAAYYDAGGNYVDYYPNTNLPANQATSIITNSDGSYFVVDNSTKDAAYYNAAGNFVAYYPANAATLDPSALPAGSVQQNDGSIKLPPGVTQEQVNALIQKAAQAGGQWLAKQVGGSTVLYPKQGGIGTIDIKKWLPIAAVVGFVALRGAK